MHGFLTCWDSESLLVRPHYGFRNASASEKLQITVSNIYLQFFSHDRSKKALGNHSTRLGDGELELFPGLSFTYLIFVKPHKHICVNFCPVWIFTELTQKSGILTGFTRTSGIFTDLTQSWRFWYKYIVYYVLSCWFIVFYRVYVYVHLVLSCLLCWSIVLIMLSNHTLVNLSQDETFLGRKSRMTLLISDKVVCNIVRTKVIEMFSHMQGGRKRVQHCKESLVGQCQARWRMSGPNRHNLQSEEDLNILL